MTTDPADAVVEALLDLDGWVMAAVSRWADGEPATAVDAGDYISAEINRRIIANE